MPSPVHSSDKGNLPFLPSKKILILTCMDSRVPANPAEALGLNPADCHIVRNAGGRAKDALRSIIVSQRVIGAREIAIVHHTDCGMMRFTTSQMHALLEEDSKRLTGEGSRSTKASSDLEMEFLEFSSPEDSVREDMDYLKSHDLVLDDIRLSGWVYRVEDGKVTKVA